MSIPFRPGGEKSNPGSGRSVYIALEIIVIGKKRKRRMRKRLIWLLAALLLAGCANRSGEETPVTPAPVPSTPAAARTVPEPSPSVLPTRGGLPALRAPGSVRPFQRESA